MKSSIAPGLPGPRRLAGIGALACAAMVAQASAFAQQGTGSATAAASAAPQAPTDAAPQRSDPKRVAATAAQVQALRKDGRTAEALAVLEAALKAAPRDAQLRFLYGVTVAEDGRSADAIAVFEQLAADFPELPEPHNNLAVMYAAAGDLDKARAALENSVRALPGYALAHENLGDLYLRMAARSWERAGQADSRNRSAPAKLALARELMQKISSAQAGAGGTAAAGPVGAAPTTAPTGAPTTAPTGAPTGAPGPTTASPAPARP